MKTLSTKTISRTKTYINTASKEQLKVIEASANKSLLERNPSGRQYAIAALEIELIKGL